ncbi:MAG: hypothetical protein GYB49_10390 [Alphaproteobacteria bacterium]|nr:hypothetical protein [Alphaproteobacteria bacterium]
MSFRPYPVMTVFTLVSLVILVMLGNWQYGRFSEKMALDEMEPEWQMLEGRVVPGSEAMVYAYADGASAWRRVVAIDRGDDIVFTTIELLYQVDAPVPCQGPDCGSNLKFAAEGIYKAPGGKNPFAGKDHPASGVFYSYKPAELSQLLSPENAARVNPDVFEPQTLRMVENGRAKAGRNPFARLRMDDQLPPQRHFGYAITWWGLAMALLAVYLAFHHQKGRLRLRGRNGS